MPSTSDPETRSGSSMCWNVTLSVPKQSKKTMTFRCPLALHFFSVLCGRNRKGKVAKHGHKPLSECVHLPLDYRRSDCSHCGAISRYRGDMRQEPGSNLGGHPPLRALIPEGGWGR